MGLDQKFKPNKEVLKLKDVEINTSGLSPDQADQKINWSTSQPQVFYYNIQLPTQSIKKLIVDSNSFLPELHIQFIDSLGLMHDVGFPADNATITIIIPSGNPSLANIFIEFKIQKFQIEIMRDKTTRKVHMWGVCNVENIIVKDYRSYNMTSYDLFKSVAQKTGVGFVSNVETSLDKMNWINPGWNGHRFLQDTINKSWVGDSGYTWGFLDLYYNLNYIDVEKQLSQDLNEVKWIDVNFISAPDEVPQLVTPTLTNNDAQIGSASYFLGEKILNQSTDISLNRGYIRNVHFYDIDGNWAEKAGSYKQYKLDTITTSGTESASIILKGDPGSTDFYNNNQSYLYLDKLDTKNMFPDFLWAKVQNEENLYDIQKINIQILLPIPNFNIKRFEKVQLMFVNNKPNVFGNVHNVNLNGSWLVTGIKFEWNGDILYQYVNLIKRELTPMDI